MSVLILATKYLLNMHNFKDLKVWQKAIDLAVDVYKAMLQLPNEEKFGLISQIKRAAISIPSNIAEGAGRNSNTEFNHFLGIANGSSFELQTQLKDIVHQPNIINQIITTLI